MRLDHSFTVPVGIDEAWRVLLDVPRVAPCMPGATLTEFDGEAFTGTVKVKVGPIVLTYTGKGRFVERDEEAHRVVMEASGRDTRAAGTASATVTAVLVADGDQTRVDVATDLVVTGRPAQFGRGMLADVGGRLVGQFADCLASEIASPTVDAPPPTAPNSLPEPTSSSPTSTSPAASSPAASSAAASSAAAGGLEAASAGSTVPAAGSTSSDVASSDVALPDVASSGDAGSGGASADAASAGAAGLGGVSAGGAASGGAASGDAASGRAASGGAEPGGGAVAAGGVGPVPVRPQREAEPIDLLKLSAGTRTARYAGLVGLAAVAAVATWLVIRSLRG